MILLIVVPQTSVLCTFRLKLSVPAGVTKSAETEVSELLLSVLRCWWVVFLQQALKRVSVPSQ